jgi:glycine/D-amino acid oxidase-like deaminating enzyme
LNKKIDYIIVGQGIAGTTLAFELIKKNKSILVINNDELSSSSKVAAGIWNPVVFKRLTKSWMADELIPALNSFYTEISQLLNQQLTKKINIAKLFTEEQEKILWIKKVNEEMSEYLNSTISKMTTPLASEFALVNQSGNLDTKLFLNESKNYFQKQNCFLDEKFDFEELQLDLNKIRYKDYNAEKIIFCEGYRIQENPFFKWIPMKPAKGDVLTIYCKELNLDVILNKGVFILPLGNHFFKVGATYNWDKINNDPDENAKQELLTKLNKIISFDFEVINHESGVRPAVIDRRPLIGNHPKHKQLFVFNGLGTKAVMLAPYFAKELALHLTENHQISEEINIDRFIKHFSE